MKKYIFLAALMVIGLSSCSSEHDCRIGAVPRVSTSNAEG